MLIEKTVLAIITVLLAFLIANLVIGISAGDNRALLWFSGAILSVAVWVGFRVCYGNLGRKRHGS